MGQLWSCVLFFLTLNPSTGELWIWSEQWFWKFKQDQPVHEMNNAVHCRRGKRGLPSLCLHRQSCLLTCPFFQVGSSVAPSMLCISYFTERFMFWPLHLAPPPPPLVLSSYHCGEGAKWEEGTQDPAQSFGSLFHNSSNKPCFLWQDCSFLHAVSLNKAENVECTRSNPRALHISWLA